MAVSLKQCEMHASQHLGDKRGALGRSSSLDLLVIHSCMYTGAIPVRWRMDSSDLLGVCRNISQGIKKRKGGYRGLRYDAQIHSVAVQRSLDCLGGATSQMEVHARAILRANQTGTHFDGIYETITMNKHLSHVI